MPRLFRSMYEFENRPVVGTERNQLGVRVHPVPQGGNADVYPDAEGCVPDNQGMSVCPHWKKLPPLLIPERLKDISPKARGDNALRCFRFGTGPFAESPVAAGLKLTHTDSRHGLVEPAERTEVTKFQDALAATKNGWLVDETDEQ